MEMVAATKMRKAQNQALAGRPYSLNLSEIIAKIQAKGQKQLLTLNNPLLQSNDSKKKAVILLTTDRSLCGALNTNIFRFLLNSELGQALYFTIGKKGRDFLVKTGKDLVADFENNERVHAKDAAILRKTIVESFLKGEVGEVYVLFPNFISILRQEPKMVKLLPLEASAFAESLPSLQSTKRSIERSDRSDSSDMLFEPDLNQLLDFALIHHLDTQIYQAMVETKASEHSARMMAMKNATDNAKELVSDLTLSYNGVRQDAITRELAEISTASMALE